MYGNEDAVGEGVRQAMEEYGIPREDIFDFELTDEEMDKIGQLDRNEKHDWY